MNELFLILMSWASSLSGYPAPDTMPEVQFVEHEFFVENACFGKECDVLAWYNDNGIVYMDERYKDNMDWFAKSLYVHEAVHFLQHQSGDVSDDCSDFVAREKEAYWIQSRFISEALYRRDTIRPKWMACKDERA